MNAIEQASYPTEVESSISNSLRLVCPAEEGLGIELLCELLLGR